LAQDDYYYEIQLTNKQLVFYFMAGAAGLVLSFLAGVMVGRGVEGGAAANASDTRAVAEERVVAEPSPTPLASPAASDFSYPQRLEADRPEEGLEKPRPGTASTAAPAPPAATPARPAPTPARAAATPATLPPVPTPAARPTPTPRPAPAGGLPKALPSTAQGFAIQVGAFKDRAGADTVVKNLKGRGFPAFTVPPPGGGLFTVRVGVYRDRADAESVQDRLRDDKFKPYIVKQ
jgi:cell division septation protein DedD